jgi:capsular polysaccharide biosynthesis protein/MinD-like ATPase involved in chromosome partitioning or flagellar assembly
MQLQHYFWVLRHWLYLILLGVCLCTAATFAVSFLFRPDYQAIALIQVNGSPTSTTNDVYSNQALAVADSLLITSTDVLRAASQKVPGTSLDELIASVSASPKDGTEVIEVRAHSRKAQLAADMANAVTDTFLQMQITSATANLNAYAHELTLDVDAAKNNLQTAQQQLLVLQQSKATPDAIQKLHNQVNWYQASYNTLLATYRQTQLQLLQADTMLTVAQRALSPSTSVLPRLLLNSVLAAGISLLLMLTLAIVLDWLDTTLKTPHDVQQLAKLTPLGSMPQCAHPLRLPTAQKTVPAHDIAVEQALIIIGASFKRLYRDQKIVLVTSLRSGAGVTTTVSNLALLLAQSGTRVLIVDANQRRPGLSELFDLSQSACSAAGTAIDPALQMPASWPEQWSTPIANLWCMPVSAGTGAFSQPLAASALGKLLRALVQQAATTAVDIILLDAPALEEDASALALASIADGTLLVVAAGQTRGERVRQAQAVLQRLGAPLGSVLINRQKVTHRSYFYTLHDNSKLVAIESLATLPAGVLKSARPNVVRSETAFDHNEAAQKQAQVVTVQPSNNGLEITN